MKVLTVTRKMKYSLNGVYANLMYSFVISLEQV